MVRNSEWIRLPPDHRIDSLPDVLIGLTNAALCRPGHIEAHRQKVAAAVEHGTHRRQQGFEEHLIFAEYHTLRQSIWSYLARRFGFNNRTSASHHED